MDYIILTIKYILVFFNFLCAVFGIVIIVLSALAMKELGADSKSICISLLVLGIIIFTIAFFGCCGALTENLCCVLMYAITLFVLMVCNLIISIDIKGLNNSENARDDINFAWRRMLEGSSLTMHFYQTSMECCGKTSFNDYPTLGMSIPMSCYRDYTMTPSHLHKEGCIEELTKLYKSCHWKLYIFTWVVFGIEVVCFVLAIALAVMYYLEY